MDHDERRRFFRIDDVVAIHYEVMTDDEAVEQQKSLRQERLGPRDRIMDSEKELQLLIDKLRIQNPEFARAIELLNIKFSILKDESPDRPGDLYGSNQIIQEVSISACGLSFGYETRIAAGRKMFLDTTLLPTDLHVRTMSEVVDCSVDPADPDRYQKRVEFYDLDDQEEELLVRHLVKRQGKLIGQQRLEAELKRGID